MNYKITIPIYMLFLLIYLFAILLLGNINVGPFSLRVYATVLMAIYIFIKLVKGKYVSSQSITKSYLSIFVVYTIMMAISLACNGEFFEYGFIKQFLAYYLVCIVAYGAMDFFIHDKRDVMYIVVLLSFILNFNNVITYLQFVENDMGWEIGRLFVADVAYDADFIERHGGEILGNSLTPGIFGQVVANAFCITIFTPLLVWPLSFSKSKLVKAYFILSIGLSFIACFMTQQRASFGLMLIGFLIVFCMYMKDHPIAVACLFLVGIVAITTIIGVLARVDMGRLSNIDNSDRMYLWECAINFICDNPFFGGPLQFQRIAGLPAHNIILDSWVFSGFCGWVVMMILYFKTLVLSIKNIVRGFTLHSECIFSAIALFLTMLYGLFHNTSYLTGDVAIFIILVLLLKFNKFETH